MEDKKFQFVRTTIERYPTDLHLIFGAVTCPEDLKSMTNIKLVNSSDEIRLQVTGAQVFVWDLTGKLQLDDEVYAGSSKVLLVPVPEETENLISQELDEFAKLLGL